VKHRSRWLLVLVVFSLLALVPVASASAAQPEVEVEAGQKFPIEFTYSGGTTEITNTAGNAIKCSSGFGEGAFTGAHAGIMTLTLSSCATVPFGTSCTTSGQTTGKIKTASMPIVPVYIKKSTHEVGLDINYAEPGHEPAHMAQFVCGSSEGWIGGSALAPVSPVNTFTTSHTLTLAGSSGIQKPSAYENESGGQVSAFPKGVLIGTATGSLSINVAGGTLTTFRKLNVKG
jgi:hypothetical protein